MRLDGKRAFITAAGQGIGRATAEAFLREGAEVVATDVNGDLLDGLVCETAVLDVLDKAAAQAAVAEAKPDILFNCAGFVHAGTVLEASDADWDFAFNLNCRAMFHTMQAVIPGMIERGGGVIINMSSGASSIMGAPNRFIYGTGSGPIRFVLARSIRRRCTNGCARPGIMRRRIRILSRVKRWDGLPRPRRLRPSRFILQAKKAPL